MEENGNAAEIGLAFRNAPPASVEAGVAFSFSVSLTLPAGIGHEDAAFSILSGEDLLEAGPLPAPAEGGAFAFALNAPEEPGTYRLVFSVSAGKDAPARGFLPFVIAVVPHRTSLAVWDTPSPVVAGSVFAVKVGAKCSARCALAGRSVEVRDEADNVVAKGELGDAPLPGTEALYWTTLSFAAPAELRLHVFTAAFAPDGLSLAHEGAATRFSFMTVAPPEHSVTVKVLEHATRTPVAGAHVRLGPYRVTTDESGAARISAPKGTFPLTVSRAGYKMSERSLRVSRNVTVRITAEALPEEDPFAHWTA